ncbi:MAG: TauD/TfdA family dioxygenase [Cyanobacteria bacterium P01_B01_bin.77]
MVSRFSLSETCRLNIPTSLANDLLAAAESLPAYANEDYYSTELQIAIYQRVYQHCAEELDWLVKQVRELLNQQPYIALVSGLKFDKNHRLLVTLNRAFGVLVAGPYKKPRAQLIHYIQPATDRPSAKSGHYGTELLHTDTADWDPPVEIISMMCVRPDPHGGGNSLVLDIDSIRQEVINCLGSDVLQRLESEKIPWQLPSYRGGGFVQRPILTESTVCWRRYTIEQSVTAAGIQLSESFLTILDDFQALLANTSRTLEFPMCAGEILFLNNWRTLHARTYIENAKASDRLMLRSWILTSDAE